MGRIVISSAGTMGDFVPFVALGKRLRDRGHSVVMAVNPAMIPLVERAGLEGHACGLSFGRNEAQSQAAIFAEDGISAPKDLRAQLRRLDLGKSFGDLKAAAESVDLLISSSLQGVAPWVHEATAIPWINATIFAMEFPHGDQSSTEPSEAEREHWRVIFDHRNEVRGELGLPPITDDRWKEIYWSDRLVLIASSRHFSQPRLEKHPQAQMTGFWFDEDPATDWVPDHGLAAFLERGPAPLVLTLSSLPVEDPAHVVNLHAEAATRLGVRLIIQGGWAGLDRTKLDHSKAIEPEDIHFTGHVPHAWLFPRSEAVIHHGGIGTTAQAMRCGRPTLVEPYCNDQFFNASQVAALGVGAAVDHRRLMPENLAAVLAELVLTPESRKNAADLAQKIGAEDGLNVACDLIEGEITRSECHRSLQRS